MVLTNMPIVYPLFKRWFEKGLTSRGGTCKSGTDNSLHSYALSSSARNNSKADPVRSELEFNASLPSAPVPAAALPRRHGSYSAWYDEWDLENGHRVRAGSTAAPEWQSCCGALDMSETPRRGSV